MSLWFDSSNTKQCHGPRLCPHPFFESIFQPLNSLQTYRQVKSGDNTKSCKDCTLALGNTQSQNFYKVSEKRSVCYNVKFGNWSIWTNFGRRRQKIVVFGERRQRHFWYVVETAFKWIPFKLLRSQIPTSVALALIRDKGWEGVRRFHHLFEWPPIHLLGLIPPKLFRCWEKTEVPSQYTFWAEA